MRYATRDISSRFQPPLRQTPSLYGYFTTALTTTMSGFAALNANGHEPQQDSKYQASVQAAFPEPQLQQRIFVAGARDPVLSTLFHDIAQSVLHSRSQPHSSPPPSKKRKLEDNASQAPAQSQPNGASSGALQNPQTAFSCKDVSFQIPMRKKLRLDLATDAQNSSRHAVRMVNQTSNETEYTLPSDQIEQAFCMAVPDKQARQTNFVLYPNAEAGLEPVVFALNEAAPAAGVISGGDAVQEDDTYVSVTERALTKILKSNGTRLVKPTDAEFASSIPQSHRKGEKGYHVRAHRGSKEGTRTRAALTVNYDH